MTKQPDISLEIVRWKKACFVLVSFLGGRIALFFDFRLYDRNYEGSEGGRGQCSAVELWAFNCRDRQ